MKTFRCTRCDHTVYFANTQCENCGNTLGMIPEERVMAAFERVDDRHWRRLGRGQETFHQPCANYVRHKICNWMLPENSVEDFCPSCRLTQIIPALNKRENRQHWYRLELAKRRLIFSL